MKAADICLLNFQLNRNRTKCIFVQFPDSRITNKDFTLDYVQGPTAVISFGTEKNVNFIFRVFAFDIKIENATFSTWDYVKLIHWFKLQFLLKVFVRFSCRLGPVWVPKSVFNSS